MSSVFSVSVTRATVRLDGKSQGTTTYNVTNSSGRPLRGRAQLQPLESTGASWLGLTGEAMRNFAVNETHQFTVTVAVPPATAGGTYSFRLDVVSVENPDEDFTEGQTVAVEVLPPAEPTRRGRLIPLTVAAVLALAIGGLTWWLLTRKVEVPEVSDRPLQDALAVLDKKQLGHHIENVPDTTGRYKLDEVVSQSPEPGTFIARGDVVTLRVQRVEVPDVTTGSWDGQRASDEIKSKKLMPKLLFVHKAVENPQPYRVVAQAPKPGEKVLPGTLVVLSVFETSPFVGKWTNVNPESPTLESLVISRDKEAQLIVHLRYRQRDYGELRIPNSSISRNDRMEIVVLEKVGLKQKCTFQELPSGNLEVQLLTSFESGNGWVDSPDRSLDNVSQSELTAEEFLAFTKNL
jgi:PASTA domain-containing protein